MPPTCTSCPGNRPPFACMAISNASKYKVLDNGRACAPCFTKLRPKIKSKPLKRPEMWTLAMKSQAWHATAPIFFMQKNGVGAVFREIPSNIMTCEQLGLPVGDGQAGLFAAWTGDRHGPHRQRQVDHVGGHYRRSQPHPVRPYYHHRRSDRICAQQPGVPGQPSGGGDSYQIVLRSPAWCPS